MRIVLNTRLYEIYISRDLENNYLKENNCEAYRYNQHEVVDSLQILLCFWRPGNLIFSNNIFFFASIYSRHGYANHISGFKQAVVDFS